MYADDNNGRLVPNLFVGNGWPQAYGTTNSWIAGSEVKDPSTLGKQDLIFAKSCPSVACRGEDRSLAASRRRK
jgi:hypothetical protein